MKKNKFSIPIKKDKSRFDKFNWNVYKSKDVYKLRLAADETILGFICLIDHSGEDHNFGYFLKEYITLSPIIAAPWLISMSWYRQASE